jgi:hypothetical protein
MSGGARMIDGAGNRIHDNEAEGQTTTTLLSLPPEVLTMIISHCAIDALVRLQRTSRALDAVASPALDHRRRNVVATIGIKLLPWVAGHFLGDDANAVGVLLMTGHLRASMCFPGDIFVLDLLAVYDGDGPFDSEVHYGGAFITMSPVALAIWVGAADVLTLLAGTTVRRGHTRHSLLNASVKAADRARRHGRAYPLGVMIDIVLAMTPPEGMLRRLFQARFNNREPPLISLLRAAQTAAGVIALKERASSHGLHLDTLALDDALAALGASSWQLGRLVDRACGTAAYTARQRTEALYLALVAAQQVQLARGVHALVGAGLGPDVGRVGAYGGTIRETFFGLISQGPPEDNGDDGLDPSLAIAHATLALLTMILCDRHGGSSAP